jgi:uncharacterized protein
MAGFKIKDSFEFLGGLGLRPVHYPWLASHRPQTARWFEVISENFMDSQGQPLTKLLHFRKDFEIACHGVSLGIGNKEPVNKVYLEKLKSLIEKIDPFIVSDHLCWNGVGGHNSHDLLPLPYTDETLRRVVDKVNQVQDYLQRTLLLENPSAYLAFEENEFAEWDFLSNVAKLSGCKILLDINNVYVSCKNFSWDAKRYLDSIPAEKIGQIHLAGHTDMGTHLFDTHAKSVSDPVWDLFKYKARGLTATPVMIEWDDEIPEFPIYEQELLKAEKLWQEGHKNEISVFL